MASILREASYGQCQYSNSSLLSSVGKRLLDDLSADANEPLPAAKRVLLMPPTAGGVNQKLGLIVQERTGTGE